jgi:NADH:ubiquinone reductase (H+-translocating)
MAWNVVIAGGGFGGAHATRELKRLLPKHPVRLVLVNDVNFLLYTLFLPEAAAGTLEPRHVLTPVREILKRTYLRMARAYHLSQIPGTARKIRAVVDWTVGLPFPRDVAEVGSIGHPRPLRDEVYARGGTHRPVG